MGDSNKIELIIPEKIIANKVLLIRNEKVILDFHLSQFYGIETRVLKQSVKRNLGRFPIDFMFELSENEIDSLVSHSVIPSKKHLGGARPYAFTESGVAMMSGVLNSKKAIDINIAIIRIFVKLRKISFNFNELELWKIKVESSLKEHNDNIIVILEYLKQFEETNVQETEKRERKPIGFKAN